MVRGAPARGRKLQFFILFILYCFPSGISWGVCCPSGLLRPRVCAPSHHLACCRRPRYHPTCCKMPSPGIIRQFVEVGENIEEELAGKLRHSLRETDLGVVESLSQLLLLMRHQSQLILSPQPNMLRRAFTLKIKVDSMAMVLIITWILSRMFRLES